MKNKKKLIAFAVPLAVLLIYIILSGGCQSKTVKDYNVVVILIDALRSDHLPFYGYERNTAPFLSELAQKGTVFENAFGASSWTSPATASIFTSLLPYQHGVLMGLLAIRSAQKIDPEVKLNRIPEEATTITEILKAGGYRTFGVADNLNIDERQGFTQGFDRFETHLYQAAPKLNETVKSWHQEITSGGKYFLYLHYMEPHAPYHPREPWFSSYGGQVVQGDHPPANEEDDTNDDGNGEGEDKESIARRDARRKNGIAAYDSEINYADKHIQELYELFHWDQNTIVIVTADHGEGLWDHGMMGHGKTLYREEIQVPLLIVLPGQKNGRRITHNVSNIDILPTVRELVELDDDTHVEGVSLAPLLKEQISNFDYEKRDIFSHLWVHTYQQVEWRSTIYKNWHFLNKLPNQRQLYYLTSDPKETDNKISKGEKQLITLKNAITNLSNSVKNSSKPPMSIN